MTELILKSNGHGIMEGESIACNALLTESGMTVLLNGEELKLQEFVVSIASPKEGEWVATVEGRKITRPTKGVREYTTFNLFKVKRVRIEIEAET